VAINDQAIQNWDDLRFKIADLQPGNVVSLKVIRDGREMTVKATIIELETEATSQQEEKADKDVGLSLTPLTSNLARRYGLSTTEGLLITEVKEFSPAARAGLQAGEIILEVNRNKVASVKEFQAILKKAEPDEEIILLVRREEAGSKIDFIVTLRIP